jgi:hypothetical protein
MRTQDDSLNQRMERTYGEWKNGYIMPIHHQCNSPGRTNSIIRPLFVSSHGRAEMDVGVCEESQRILGLGAEDE